MSKEMICTYCGKERDKVMFVIGASREVDWVINEGTGKISCDDPVCWQKGRDEGQARIDAHFKSINASV